MKQQLLLFSLLAASQVAFAQQAGNNVRGTIVGAVSNEPMSGVIIKVLNQDIQTVTFADGSFVLPNLRPGKYTIQLNSVNIVPKTLVIEVLKGADTETGPIAVNEINAKTDMSAVGIIDAELFDDDGGNSSTQDVSTTVILSNDVFLNRAAYQLSPTRFVPRGYDNTRSLKYINGIAFNDQNRGVFNYAAVGALNDMTRNGDVANYTAPSLFSYGELGGTENINMRASTFRKGHKVTLSATNRNYVGRAMYTYSTGLSSRGWAFTTSVGGRYSSEGYIDGTYYRNLALALSAEKQWQGGKHSLSAVAFVSPVVRGQQGNTYREVYELTGNYQYNPNWGYYNGKKRNAREVHAFDPTLVLSYIWKIDPTTTLTTGLGLHYGRYGSSALNWYKGADPRPDYYRNLPSYFTRPDLVAHYTTLWQNEDPTYTQINWDNLYLANLNNVRYGNGSAIYMIEERRSDLWEATFNSTLNKQLTKNSTLTAGLEGRYTISDQFKTVKDLLGADYVLDIDKYSEQDFAGDADKMQNDLNRPNRKVYEDGIFGYHYKLHIASASAWAVNKYTSRYWDLYYGFRAKYTSFYRDGYMCNGRYPDNSYGKGTVYDFVDLGIKAGLTYKFNGRHMITGNFSYGTEAPLASNTYISPRISDIVVPDLKSARVMSADVNYVVSLPSFTGRIGLFQTNYYDQVERTSYYNDTERTYLNHVMYGANKIHRGIELGATYKIDNHWSVDIAGTAAQYYYSNNPNGVESAENGKIADKYEQVYMKNVNVGGVPNIVGTIGLRYFINYWFLGANLNGFTQNYISASPVRRLASTYATVVPGTAEYESYKILTTQERLAGAATLDLSVGKVFYLGKQSLNFNLSVNNIFNRQNIATGGYEQGRTDLSSPYKYANRYFLMQGTSVFFNASYRF